jgi:hypothetical protein
LNARDISVGGDILKPRSVPVQSLFTENLWGEIKHISDDIKNTHGIFKRLQVPFSRIAVVRLRDHG